MEEYSAARQAAPINANDNPAKSGGAPQGAAPDGALDVEPLLDLSAPVVYFPVRHHSPACARLVRELIGRVRPAAVLIEGPADFNPYMQELWLPHELPIAIYSYVRLADGLRRGAFYPFCEYSPEWQALQAARAQGAEARFIDLPWSEIATAKSLSHRYADAELRCSGYVEVLCRELGVEDFNALWDTLCEIDANLPLEEYLRRAHTLCGLIRLADGHVPAEDRRREAYMAEQIQQAAAELEGPLVVVTGAYHSYALFARLNGQPFVGLDDPTPDEWHSMVHESLNPTIPTSAEPTVQDAPVGATPPDGPLDQDEPGGAAPSDANAADETTGIALTPYSYERLDSLRGYEAGMPNPGFYHQVWLDRQTPHGEAPPAKQGHAAAEGHAGGRRSGRGQTYRQLLAEVSRQLRQRGQRVSTADLIAVETTALGLAALRGHSEVWRWDLVDAVTGALVKEELAIGAAHPFLEAVHEALRGNRRGLIAEGARVPPLVQDIRHTLAQLDLEPPLRACDIELHLHEPRDRRRSSVLHRLRILKIAGFRQTDGVDLQQRDDLAHLWEQWRLHWSPDFESSAIEASRYGPRLEEAAQEQLLEQAKTIQRDAESAALLLLDAALAGLPRLRADFQRQLLSIFRQDVNFFTNTAALGHLLYLFRYDEVLATANRDDIGALLREAFIRGMWLLESLGQVSGQDREILSGVSALVQTLEAAGEALADLHDELLDVLARVQQDHGQLPLTRGAAWGGLWALGATDAAHTAEALAQFADPQQLGDFLTGLFCLAREVVQRNPQLVASIDRLLVDYSDQQFLQALPSLRLAFTYFTPREKHYLATTLLQVLGVQPAATAESAALAVRPEQAAAALAWEAELFAALERYGLRLPPEPIQEKSP